MRRVLRILPLMALIIAQMGCDSARSEQQASLAAIRVGMAQHAVNALILIADERGYFRSNGLQISTISYLSGLDSVDGLLKDEVDAATASEFVVVGKAMKAEPVRVWASIDRYLHHYLIARKDHGIQAISDLRGKKIGIPRNTDTEFHLGRFLELNGLDFDQVTLVNSGPTDLARLLVDGEVDAVAVWRPEATTIENRFGNAIVSWPVQSAQASFFNLLSTEAWTQQHPDQVEGFLRALHEAETFYARQPEDTKALLQKRLALENEDMALMWSEHYFQLSLDQAMILAMEDEARWMINNRLTQAERTPDFLNYIYLDGMLAVQPEAVNIIR